jgi:hypothetical protein
LRGVGLAARKDGLGLGIAKGGGALGIRNEQVHSAAILPHGGNTVAGMESLLHFHELADLAVRKRIDGGKDAIGGSSLVGLAFGGGGFTALGESLFGGLAARVSSLQDFYDLVPRNGGVEIAVDHPAVQRWNPLLDGKLAALVVGARAELARLKMASKIGIKMRIGVGEFGV